MHKDPKNRDHWNASQWDPDWDPTPYLQGDRTGHGRRVIFDIESDGLLHETRGIKRGEFLWCIGAIDLDTEEKFYWGVDIGEDSLDAALKFISECDLTLAHHGIYFDYPFLERWSQEKRGREWQRPAKAWDSEVIAKVVWPYDALVGPDLARIKAGRMPGHLLKRHSLKAWGYRTGSHKVEYDGKFDEWCPAMATYLMTGDLDGPLALWRLVEKRIGWRDAKPGDLVWPELTLEVENEVAAIIFQQQEHGVRFDLEKAIKLAAELRNEQTRIERQLVETFGSWWQPLDDPEEGVAFAATTNRKLPEFPDVTIKRFSERTGKELKPYVGPPLQECAEGNRYVRIEYVTFNPSSRDHLGQRLQAVFGWKPKAFGKDGKPTVDESTLGEIPDSVMPATTRQLILDYFVVSKTLGTLSKGKKSWIGLCSEEGRIHGEMDTCGAVTRRGTHKNPNISGTPKVRTEKVVGEDGVKREVVLKGLKGRYGYECRELFIADEGWEQIGVDASSLELIDLGHYLHPLDGGAFSARVCDPTRDAHQEHSEITGTSRGDAKTAIYLKIYGGSAFKLSQDPAIIVTPAEVPKLLGYKGLPMLLRSLEKRMGEEFVSKLDDMQKARLSKARQIIIALEAGIPGLKDLSDKVMQSAAERGWLKAIDGSRIHVRKKHAALNSLLQSAGAITCKLWMMLVHRRLKAMGYIVGRDFKQTIWAHDELQFTHRPGLADIIEQVAKETIKEAGEILRLRGVYRGDAKRGGNWASCH